MPDRDIKSPIWHPEPETVEDVFDHTYKEKAGPKPPSVIVWRNVFLMSFLHVGALYGLFLFPSASVLTWIWFFACLLFSALGITAGAHRLWSHRSYKASLPLRIFLAFANSMAFQNDIYEWSRDHRVHHKYSETDADPHNAVRGFFFSHIGWLLVRKHPDVIEKGRKLELSDLKADKVVMFQRRFYKSSVLLMCFSVPTLVPWLVWGESLWVAYFVPALLRYALVLNATWLVNSAAHMWGNRPYDGSINPRENRFVAFSAIEMAHFSCSLCRMTSTNGLEITAFTTNTPRRMPTLTTLCEAFSSLTSAGCWSASIRTSLRRDASWSSAT
uniref:Acyl-CoA desaturase-like n=1 Tax=Sinocyclocheilus anshuiensis TaxID=1608454 RepID=A0A671QQ38_9TELE